MAISTAYPQSRTARGRAVKVIYENKGAAGTKFLPSRVVIVGQGAVAKGAYSTTKERIFSAAYAGNKWGYDSHIYQAALSVLPPNGDGVGDIPVTVYPLAQPTTGGVQAIGDITPSGTQTKQQTYNVKVSNMVSVDIVMAAGEGLSEFIEKAIPAVNGVLGMPGTASDGSTKLNFTVGWEGESGNDVHLEVVAPDDAEMTFVVTQPTGGAGTVSITDALAQIGNIWETHVINCLQYTDSAILNEYATFNEGRWHPEVKKPLRVYTGTAEASLTTVTAVTDARKTDRTNIILPNPGSNDLPCVIAADMVRRIAKLANENPPHDYGKLDCPRLTPGPDGVQWDSTMRQAAFSAGCSSVEVVDEVVTISDVITCYHPTGEDPPAYQYDVDLAKIFTMIHNTNLAMAPYDSGPPLVPDGQATKNPAAKKPKMVKGRLFKLIDNAATDVIISDPDYAKKNTQVGIGTTNSKRLDVKLVFLVGGNSNVISIDLVFGFYYGKG
jgi:phage tail sheath gpL-like